MQSGTALINPQLVFDKIKLAVGMRVADFGCGRTGHLVFSSAKVVGEDGIVYAVDIIKNVLQSIESMAKDSGYENIKTVWSDIEVPKKTPIPSSTLDAVYFVNVLSQLKNQVSALQEAVRLLQKNGFLVIIDWVKKLGLLGPDLVESVSPDDVSRMARLVDLNLVEEDNMSQYHYLLIFQK